MFSKGRYSVREIAFLGVALATIEVAKQVLSFVPNVELVTLLFIIYSIYMGRKTLLVAVGFIAIDCFIYGVSVWVLMYLYIWPTLILIAYFAARRDAKRIFYCVLSAVYGLLFGFFCSIPYIFMGGWQTAFGWWISGIPYDVIHCISNFVLCLILFKPLCSVMKKVYKTQ